MTTDRPVLPSSDDEIDLREVFAALQRRWPWVFGGGLLGLAMAVGVVSVQPRSGPLVQASLIVDVAQGPCYSRSRQLKTYREPSVVGLSCYGELESVRQVLNRLIKSRPIFKSPARGIAYSLDRLAFDNTENTQTEKSSTQLVLNVTGTSSLAPQISSALTQIQKDMTLQSANSAKANGFEPSFGSEWIQIEKPSELRVQGGPGLFSSLALGLLGGLGVGAGSALIADLCKNRVFSQLELLRRLGYPLRLGLPAGPWTSPAVQVLVGQLATQLDQNLTWRVLSIARQHEAVAPLTKLLHQQGGTDLQCSSAEPLLSAVLCFEPRDKPTGLLLVVESGFNSRRALEEARLLIGQMRSVQAVGVVLIGAPLPDELSPSAAG